MAAQLGPDAPLAVPTEPNVGNLGALRVCIAYDCLYPLTIGGAEHWYRTLGERLVGAGAQVIYLTRRQWTDEGPRIDGFRVVAVMPEADLYRADGTRRLRPPLRFGWGVLWWLFRHRRDVDVVRVASFPFFSLLATRLALLGTGKPVEVDWFEVWPRRFWLEYAGGFSGRVGFLVQETCIRLTSHAFVFWHHTEARLRAHGFRGRLTVLAGLLPPVARPSTGSISPAEPAVLFAGRMVKDKGVRLLPDALRIARSEHPSLRLIMVGEGPEQALLEGRLRELGLREAASFPGKVSDPELAELFATATCVVVASVREGYGLVVVEAAAAGTPSVVAANPENAATGHVVEGLNGFVVEPTPEGLARGIAAAIEGGDRLRRSTADWYRDHADSQGMLRAADEVIALHRLNGAPRQGAARST